MESDRVVLDSGAVSALSRNDERIRLALTGAIRSGARVTVPTAVIAESTTGDPRRDAATNRVLKLATPVSLDERLARKSAAIRHAMRARRSGTIDAIVVATADHVAGSVILTTDPHDLLPLAAVTGRSSVKAF